MSTTVIKRDLIKLVKKTLKTFEIFFEKLDEKKNRPPTAPSACPPQHRSPSSSTPFSCPPVLHQTRSARARAGTCTRAGGRGWPPFPGGEQIKNIKTKSR